MSMKTAIKNIIFTQWKRDDQQNAVIKSLWLFILLLMALNLFMWIGWMSAPKKLRVYIPPNISQGALVKPDHVPNATVYAFAYQIFTAINTWTESGEADYKKNIDAYKNYLSVKMLQNLLMDYATRETNGALNRKRMMSGVSGMGYSVTSVKPIGNGTWEVNMELHIVETVNTSVVKDVIMDYPLMVTQVNESIQDNPWGLAISGFYKEPYRIKTIV